MPTHETLTIEKLVYGGEGLARQEGKVVLIPFVAPGEVVRAEVDRVKNDVFRGRLLEVLSPAAARVEAPCPFFLRCGGCHLQHLDYRTQVEQKTAMLREVLRRVGKLDISGEIGSITSEAWHYRNRVQLHIDRGAVGYFEHGSRRLCPIDRCPISSPALNQAIAALNVRLPQLGSFSGAVELFTNETEVQVNVLDRAPRSIFAAIESIGTSAPIHYQGFRVSRSSFFQINRFLIDRLVDCAVGEAQGTSALDLYAGVGLFSKALAARFGQVTAVEAGHSAFRDLTHNLGATARAENATVEDYLGTVQAPPSLVLADPPRAGLTKAVVLQLIRIEAPRLVLVSCDPATLARDLHGLVASGYQIEKLTLVDLFPQTFHLETVVHLRR
ncbi:MAG TPA: class I SAM-dependent RNA methyltransferase [Bryobacteraceae bacterium]|nr:class I SAM-dependent RNA methyltransferase [Bryobacteraceae bacterium]